MISRTAEYAMRSVVWLAGRPDTAQTTKQIAKAAQIPSGYLSKVLQQLAEAGIVLSQRGLGGGSVLARPPDRLTILEIVNAIDPIQRIRQCPLSLAAHGIKLCPLHRRLDDLIALIEAAFAECTLAELIAEEGAAAPFCDTTARATRPATFGNLAQRTAATGAKREKPPNRRSSAARSPSARSSRRTD